MRSIQHIAKFTWLEARRGRQAWLILAVIFMALVIALFAADLALTDAASYRSGAYAALIRVVLVAITVLSVASSIAREQEERRLELSLSRPLARHDWYLGRLLGHGTLALAAAVAASLAAMALAPPLTAALWGLSLAAELTLMAAATLTAVVTLRQVPATVMAVGAFYVLARAMQALVLMSHGPTVDPTAWTSALITTLVSGLALVLPDLARYTQSAWLFGSESITLDAVGYIALETAVYLGLLTAVGLIDLARQDDA